MDIDNLVRHPPASSTPQTQGHIVEVLVKVRFSFLSTPLLF